MSTPETDPQAADPQRRDDPDTLKHDIEETREALGETVEALSAKADVKAQAQQKVDEVKTQAQEKVDETKAQAQQKVEEVRERPAPTVGIAGAIAALLLVLWLIRRR